MNKIPKNFAQLIYFEYELDINFKNIGKISISQFLDRSESGSCQLGMNRSIIFDQIQFDTMQQNAKVSKWSNEQS